MHFFYLDESGDTGDDIRSAEQPVMVLGGIAVRDEGWRKTTEDVRDILEEFFGEPRLKPYVNYVSTHSLL